MEQPNDVETESPSLTERIGEEGLSEAGLEEQPRSSWVSGCLGYGCLIAFLLMLAVTMLLSALWDSMTNEFSWLEKIFRLGA